jgi:hypothetical protein
LCVISQKPITTIRNHQKIEDFLIRVGRRWYVSTLFKAFKNANKVDEALVIYKKSRPNYHSVTANTIDELLGYKM